MSDRKPGYNKYRKERRKVCSFCADKATDIDYKEVVKIKKYISERGKILPRRISGNCAKHQRQVSNAIKKSRNFGLISHTSKYPE